MLFESIKGLSFCRFEGWFVFYVIWGILWVFFEVKVVKGWRKYWRCLEFVFFGFGGVEMLRGRG